MGLHLLALGLLDFMYVLAAQRGSGYQWQAMCSFVLRLLPTLFFLPCPTWPNLSASFAIACLSLFAFLLFWNRIAAEPPLVRRSDFVTMSLAIVLLPALEEYFFRHAIKEATAPYTGVFLVLSNVWFLSAHNFAEPTMRLVRSTVYCILSIQFGVFASIFVHVALNGSLWIGAKSKSPRL